MIGELGLLFDLGQDYLLAALAVFLRVGAAMALLPAFGERSIPERVRLPLALAFAIIVFPAVEPILRATTQTSAALPFWLGIEVLAGLALGIVLRLFVMALQMAGSIAAQSTSLSQILGSAGVEPLPAMGHILMVAGLALAVLLGLHVKIAEILILSYEFFPPGRLPGTAIVSDWGVLRIGRAFELAFTLSVPFVIASLIYNVALGVINRAMPQLMVAFVGAPAITAGGLILLALTAPILLETWRDAFFMFLSDPFGG